jgi:glycosyltransferase involved in cell wall biosynthesis
MTPATIGGRGTATGAPTRALFLIDELDVGGTEQQILELVRRLDRGRYDPFVVCFRPGRVAGEIQDLGVPVVTLPKRGKADVRLVAALVRLMRARKVGLLQTYLFTANTWGRVAGIIARVPVLVSSERNVDMWEEAYKRVIGIRLDRWTSATIANSHAVKRYLVGKGLPPSKVRVVYNGLDAGRFDGPSQSHATRAELGLAPGHVVVGLLARLEPAKDPMTFLRAAALLAGRLPAVSFLVVGGGSLEAMLRQQAESLGLGGRIVFTGPRRDVPRLLEACDVSVLCSLKEGMSNTVMESMAAARPMVATSVGGNVELIEDGRTGLLVPRQDATALAAAIGRLVEDRPLAQAMGRAARAWILEHCSVEGMVRATEALYDEILLRAPALAGPA